MKKIIAFALCTCLLAALVSGCAAGQKPEASAVVSPSAVPAPSEAQATPAPSSVPLSGTLKIVGSSSVGPLVVELADAFKKNNPDVLFDVVQAGSVAGIVSVANGSADIGLSSRKLNDGEADVKAQTLCYDAVAVVVNESSSVKSLSREQIAGIFKGTLTNWSEVGGGNGSIHPQLPQMASETRAMAEELLLGENAQFSDAAGSVLARNAQIVEAVKTDGNAIGILPLGVALQSGLVAVSVDGTQATAENVTAGKYPLSRPFLLLSAQNPSELANAFLNFMSSDSAAQGLIESQGYISAK